MDEIENFDELLKEPEKLKELLSEKFKTLKEKQPFNIEEDDKYKELLNKTEKFKDVDLERYNKLLELEEKVLKDQNPDEFKKLTEEKIKKQYEEALNKLQNALNDKESKLNELSEKEKKERLVNSFKTIFNTDKYKMKEDLLEDQLELFLNRFEEKDGKIVEKSGVKNEKGEDFTLEDYAEKLHTNKASLFNTLKTGTGSTNQNISKNTGLTKIGIIEANKILKENPELYKQYKENGMLDFY